MAKYGWFILAACMFAGCSGLPGPGGSGPEHASTGDMMPHDLPVEVDFASWVQGADNFVEGTVAEIRVSWSPLVDSTLGSIPVEDCAQGNGVLELVLEDVRTLGQEEVLPTMTVRVGLTGALMGFNVPEVEMGSAEVKGWHGPEPTFTEGMRVGGPIYYNPGHPDPVFPTGVHYPIYRVVDGAVRFMVKPHAIGAPYEYPRVEHLQGLTPDALWLHVVQASQAPFAPLASAYRQDKRFDDPEVIRLYAARCKLTRAEADAEPPCEDTGDICP